MAEAVEIVRAAVLRALEQSPGLMPHEVRYADYMKLRLDQVDVAKKIARELVGLGYLPFDHDANPREFHNYHAVSFTMGNMRNRLLKHIKGGGRDVEAERQAMESITQDFFADLAARGWRLVYTRLPAEHHITPDNPKGEAR